MVLVLAVTAALVVPVLSGVNVRGTAAAGPVEPPPAIGSCISDPIKGESTYTSDGSLVYPVMIMAPCQGSRYGEVAGIITSPAPPPRLPRLAGTAGSTAAPSSAQSYTFTMETDANLATCDSLVRNYVGLGPAGSVGNPAERFYTIDDPVSLMLVAPSLHQQANGQRWLACIAMIAVANSDSPYETPLQNVLTGHRVPDSLGYCSSRLSALEIAAPVLCGDDHVVEYFGHATSPRIGISAQQLAASCRQLVIDRTGMTDPTAGGRLEVLAYAMHYGQGGEPISGFDQRHAGTIDCLVHSKTGKPWKDTLLGIGTGTINWS